LKIPRRIKFAVNFLSGREDRPKPAGRNVTVFPGDIFITSYPKSGNTWVLFLVGNIVWHDHCSTDFFNIAQRTPSIYWESDSHLETFPRPRILKSHEYFDPRYPKVLYVVRDVRSVLVSYHDFLIRMGTVKPSISLYEFAKKFLRGELDKFGSWRENVLSWLKVRGDDHDRFCLVRYEDLKLNAKEELKKIASFLHLECSRSQIETAYEMSSLNRMREHEKKYFEQNPEVPTGETLMADIPVVKSGRIDGWKQVLDIDTLELIKNDCLDLLLELGYEW